jgi:hypothetical protein
LKIHISIVFLIAYSAVFLIAAAQPVRQINWDDLIPAHLRSDDLLADLDRDQRDMVNWVINMLEFLGDRGPDTEDYFQEVDEEMHTLEKAGIDIGAVMAKRKEIRTAVVEELNGQTVRIPGYLLPLEVSSEKVTEFLLVPYIGACIHVPPPPQTQIVHVNVLHNGGYKNTKLYEPVWVTGQINIQSMNKELYLVDGSTGIDIGYAMQANRVEPYKE